MATTDAAEVFGINAGIETGKTADCMLIDLEQISMTPNYHLISNLVYSAGDSCVDTLICNGKILMKHRIVPGEDEILREARRVAEDLLKR